MFLSKHSNTFQFQFFHRATNRIFFFLIPVLTFIFPNNLIGSTPFVPSQNTINHAVEIFGDDANGYFNKWLELINDTVSQSDEAKLLRVNRFINNVPFATDQDHWGREDFWATPYEFIGSNGGDCEDYAIAKYFTLRALGIEREQLRIAYAILAEKEPHMILFYIKKNKTNTLVLDNLEQKILTLANRKDLEIIYTANEQSVWDNSRIGHSPLLRDHTTLNKLSELLERIENDARFSP